MRVSCMRRSQLFFDFCIFVAGSRDRSTNKWACSRRPSPWPNESCRTPPCKLRKPIEVVDWWRQLNSANRYMLITGRSPAKWYPVWPAPPSSTAPTRAACTTNWNVRQGGNARRRCLNPCRKLSERAVSGHRHFAHPQRQRHGRIGGHCLGEPT
jgi:hypothetical protein